MPLSKAQLMETPGGPGVVGAVRAGTGIAISGDGTISIDPNSVVAKLVAGANVSLAPSTGVGTVTINAISAQADFPAGTVTLFIQSSAPLGWTQVDSQNNKAIRVVNSGGGSSGGSNPFTSVFTSVPVTGSVSLSGLSVSGGRTNTVTQTPTGSVQLGSLTVSATSISVQQLPAHTHDYQYRPPEGSQRGDGNGVNNNKTSIVGPAGGNQGHTHTVSGSGSFSGNNMSHDHSFTATASGSGTFSGNSLNLAVQYVDAILCSKS